MLEDFATMVPLHSFDDLFQAMIVIFHSASDVNRTTGCQEEEESMKLLPYAWVYTVTIFNGQFKSYDRTILQTVLLTSFAD